MSNSKSHCLLGAGICYVWKGDGLHRQGEAPGKGALIQQEGPGRAGGHSEQQVFWCASSFLADSSQRTAHFLRLDVNVASIALQAGVKCHKYQAILRVYNHEHSIQVR